MDKRVDYARLGAFSYSSRKNPEFFSLRMVTCPGCDTAFAVQPPTDTELKNAYTGAAFDTAGEEAAAAVTYARAAAAHWVGLQGPALEIGCGCGAFLPHLAQAGFSPVVGVEPSQDAVANAAPHIRPRIQTACFSAKQYQPGSFALVCCFQTLEHLSDPGGVIRDAHALLQPGGIFLTVAHDRRAWLNRLLGRRSPIIDIEHLQLYSRASLTQLMEQGGFQVETIGAIVNAYPVRYWLRLLPLPSGAKKLLSFIAATLRVDCLMLPLPVGNVLAVGRKALI